MKSKIIEMLFLIVFKNIKIIRIVFSIIHYLYYFLSILVTNNTFRPRPRTRIIIKSFIHYQPTHTFFTMEKWTNNGLE